MSLSDNEVILHTEGLTRHYDEIKALTNLDLEVRRGEIFGYIGHNGAGKTTTIRILAGLLRPSSGSASVAGVNVVGGRDRIKRLVGYMPDNFGVYEQMRVWEYLDFFGAAFGIGRRRRRERIEEVIDMTEAHYMHDRFVDTLSRGMKQRVGIARTLMHDPQVLLLDEPASGLDPRARVHMRQLLRRLADAGKTLLVSSHILPELAAVCDSIGILHGGVLRAVGPIAEVLASLRRHRLMEVRLLGDVEKAIGSLKENDRCKNVERSEESDNVVDFHFTGDDEELATILDGLVRSDLRIVTCREVPLTLEEAYMTVSGFEGELEEEEGQEDDSGDSGAAEPD
ncbi:MAG: ABC transporter ATP-binding protein [Phycisphaerae bacterium]|nr:ABC transporter ATP-binding protein [Phycisphaerae bacterium]